MSSRGNFLKAKYMRKIDRTFEEALEIATRKVYRYILALQVLYAKRVSCLHGAQFDADIVEQSLIDQEDSELYWKQQNDIKRSFCIPTETLRKFTKVRFKSGTRVPMEQVMARVSKHLRVKSYNKNGTASYSVGSYSKMYIFNYEAFIELCLEWHASKAYNEKFDLKSSYYQEIYGELSRRFKLKFTDLNKFAYRKDGSNDLDNCP